MRTSSKGTPGVAVQVPTCPGAPSTHVPSVMQSPLQPGDPWPRLCTCVGSVVSASASVSGYRAGSGKKEGHSPEGKGVSVRSNSRPSESRQHHSPRRPLLHSPPTRCHDPVKSVAA